MSRVLLEELTWRSLVQETTPGLEERLAGTPLTGYVGFDPTAQSLQIGNLVPVMLLVHLQRHGHRPIILVGGGTALIGDPSGKRTERPLLAKADVEANAARLRHQLERFLDFSGPNAARMANNADWLTRLSLIEFLRDSGKHFTVRYMMQKESVQTRLESGLSYTEFTYMLLQAYDFLHLFQRYDCELQMGGSDQWGNITAGVELIRRVTGGTAHGLVAPLVSASSGAKFGKSREGAVWLDASLTSAYKFFQYWLNVDDRDVERHLKLFTLLPPEEIAELLGRFAQDPQTREAQRVLARDVTTRVHGADAAERVERASHILFGGFDPREAAADVFETLAGEIPTTDVDGELAIADLLVAAGLSKSKSEARRSMAQGGIYVNQERLQADRTITGEDWLAGGYLLLRKGNKNYAIVRAERGAK